MTGTDDAPPADEDDDETVPSSSLGDLAESIRERQGTTPSTDDGSADDSPFEWADVGDADRESDDPFESLDDASDVLVLGPVQGAACNRNCVSLLSTAPLDRTNVLAVTVTKSANDWISMWKQHSSGSPASLTLISLGEETRGGSTSTTITTGSSPGTITIETVTDPSDLTRLGVTLSRLLSEVTTPNERTAVCVHSLTALLQYVEPRRLFRFLHILRAKLESVNATAHYHMDPGAHDDQTVGVFRSLFDTVVRITDDGGVEIVSTPE